MRAEGYPAPAPVTGVDRGILVFRRPPGTNLAERMIGDMPTLPRLLADFGRLHAALHALPVPEGPPVVDPVAPPPDEEAAPAVARQRAWLDREHRPAAHRVVCHGDLNPVHVLRDGDATPGVPVNWTAATVAEPEHDVAATLVGFWSSALYGNAVQRRLLCLAREPLASAYLSAYRDVAPWSLEDDRLRYWQAFHLHGLAVAIDRRAARSGRPLGPGRPRRHAHPLAAGDRPPLPGGHRRLTAGTSCSSRAAASGGPPAAANDCRIRSAPARKARSPSTASMAARRSSGPAQWKRTRTPARAASTWAATAGWSSRMGATTRGSPCASASHTVLWPPWHTTASRWGSKAG